MATAIDVEERVQTFSAVPSGGGMRLLESVERAIPMQERLDSMRSWREEWSPTLRRSWSAGQLLFQFVGVAGYAGYFVSMHVFMRVLSGSLMAGAWYAIYRIRGAQG
jgi:hypothetical protein